METLAYVREKGGEKILKLSRLKKRADYVWATEGSPPQDRVLLAEGWEPGEGHLQLLLGTVQW